MKKIYYYYYYYYIIYTIPIITSDSFGIADSFFILLTELVDPVHSGVHDVRHLSHINVLLHHN